MNTAAWQPSPTARRGRAVVEWGKTKAGDAGMIFGMAFSPEVRKPLRVLVPEGNSTSPQKAVTILGLGGHLVEVCDPSPYCLSRFSRSVRKFHRCPGMRDVPVAFL